MRLSVLIPHHYGVVGADNFLRHCVKSLKGYDEIVVYANDGIGYAPAVNFGLELVTGDQIIVCNNDTIHRWGNLRDLVVNNCITTPKINPQPKDNEPRAIFCISRILYEQIIEKYGYFYDERFETGYWEDDDLIKRIQEMGIGTRNIESVVFDHIGGGGNTMKQMGEQHFYDLNKQKFEEKWGG